MKALSNNIFLLLHEEESETQGEAHCALGGKDMIIARSTQEVEMVLETQMWIHPTAT